MPALRAAASLHSFPIFKTGVDAFSTDLRAASLLVTRSERGVRFAARTGTRCQHMVSVSKLAARWNASSTIISTGDDPLRLETTLREKLRSSKRGWPPERFSRRDDLVAGGDAGPLNVAERGGGHIASEASLFDIYERSMNMLRRAFEENKRKNIEVLAVYDNPRTPVKEQPRPSLVVEMARGSVTQIRSTSRPGFTGAARAARNSNSGDCGGERVGAELCNLHCRRSLAWREDRVRDSRTHLARARRAIC